MPFDVGMTLDRYELREKIGSGGYADVYKGFHRGLRRLVAIKVLKSERRRDPSLAQAFLREARTAANLAHPNIVVIHDVGEEHGVPYIVMEYAPGGDLREQIQRYGPLPRGDLCRWFDQIAEALNHAHRQNFVHCDVKPSNILLDADRRVKLADFGIARAVARHEEKRIRKRVGTLPYMSPEHISGKQLDHRSDIYSLGVVLFEMLTGRVPFKDVSSSQVLLEQVRRQPPRPSSVNPELPAEVDRVVFRALAENPESRYQSTLQMARELREALRLEAGLGPISRPSAPRRSDRLWVWAAIAGGTTVALAAFLFLRPDRGQPTPTPTPPATRAPTATRASGPVLVSTATEGPTATLTEVLFDTATPTATPKPTSTLRPTDTPLPTNTPVPATATPEPTPAPTVTLTSPPPPPQPTSPPSGPRPTRTPEPPG